MYEARQNKEAIFRQIQAGGRQAVQFKDGKHKSNGIPIQCSFDKVIQRIPNGRILEQNNSHYRVVYYGSVQDFQGGSNAGKRGITGVDSYWAIAVIGDKNGEHETRGSNIILASTHEYQYGHMLAKDLGGSGRAHNIFRQDGGQNTTGAWPSFERTIANLRKNKPSNMPMEYYITLNGNLNYDQQF